MIDFAQGAISRWLSGAVVRFPQDSQQQVHCIGRKSPKVQNPKVQNPKWYKVLKSQNSVFWIMLIY